LAFFVDIPTRFGHIPRASTRRPMPALGDSEPTVLDDIPAPAVPTDGERSLSVSQAERISDVDHR
jgi:hypothetical protein